MKGLGLDNTTIDHLNKELALKRKYTTRLPISINVIKPNGFNRVGSILEPFDRLTYQLIVDTVSVPADAQIDRENVFSNKLLADDPEGFMFEKSHEAYSSFKSRISELCVAPTYQFALRADIASYYFIIPPSLD
jgi:hypothetical protein